MSKDDNAHKDVPREEMSPANGGKPIGWPRTRDDTAARQEALFYLEMVGAAIRAWQELKADHYRSFCEMGVYYEELAAPLEDLACLWPEIRELMGYLRLHR